jgi:hypothetical protein
VKAAVSEGSELLLWMFIATVLAIMAKLAFAGTPREAYIKSFGHSARVTGLFNFEALEQSIKIATPVFLGFSLPLPKDLTSVPQILVIFGALVYIILWLWMQRSISSYVGTALSMYYQHRSEFTTRRIVTQLAFNILAIASLYLGWYRLASLNWQYFWTLIVFAADLFFQLVLIGHMWVLRPRGTEPPPTQ